MAQNLSSLDGWLSEHDWPRVACPVCDVGTIGYDKVVTYPDQESMRLMDEETLYGGPRPEIQGAFSGSFECDNTKCSRRFAISGDWRSWINEGDPRLGDFGEMYQIRHITPPLKIMKVPSSAPTRVKAAITAASSVLWLSPSSAANQLRQAVEELLTTKKIRRTSTDKKGKTSYRSLHSRIVEYRATDKEVAAALEAVKWIGNGGSHDNALSISDVLVGAEILELALKSLYDKSDALLMAKVKAINTTKGRGKKS